MQEDRENSRAGTIAATFVNVNRTKRTDKVWTSSDFFKPLKQKPLVQSPEQMLSQFEALAAFSKARRKNKNAKSK